MTGLPVYAGAAGSRGVAFRPHESGWQASAQPGFQFSAPPVDPARVPKRIGVDDSATFAPPARPEAELARSVDTGESDSNPDSRVLA